MPASFKLSTINASAILSVTVLTVLGVWLKTRRKVKLPLPPSPPGDPILRHLRYIPAEGPEDQFAEWSKEYGDVMLVRVLNRKMIILNSAEAAIDLLERRSWNYSDRPDFPIFKILDWVPSLTFLPYGKQFQKHRRLFKQYFGKAKVINYSPIQTREARRLALNLLANPSDRETHLHQFATAIVVRIAFGHDILSADDPYAKITGSNSYILHHCGPPGGTPVDLFPFLQYFPSWFPGAFFAGRAREFRAFSRDIFDYPIVDVQQQMANGTAKPSFLSYHLERLHREENETPEELEDVKGAAGTIYGAATDTTWSSLSVLILAMTLYPEVQQRVHQELDELLEGSRLPEIEDRRTLPYLECALKETLRCFITHLRAGVPHRVMEDDVYKGMFIPKGSLVFANMRGISMNDAVHHEPQRFNPSRYLPKSQGGLGEPDPAAFGFGRRICPGRYLADTSLWLAMATILSLYEIRKVKGPDGKEITPTIALISGLTSHPKPYQCEMHLRNEKARKLLEQIRVELMSE
ncbi:O-methylsterigmatocystin oxidoreductase [Leucoagaricus sp. SymC.cos]|nr:O-methylsterigmatocystin oxidoreductase [Leucoagaricus sp. SymC.cos]